MKCSAACRTPGRSDMGPQRSPALSNARNVPNYDLALGSIEAAVRSATNRFVLTVSNANGGVRPSNMTVKYYKGTHQWRYWDAAMCASLPMLMSALGVSYTPLLTCNTL
jgi:S-formylglutathione hydrolase FrmB